jgi:hypothetical protein
MKALVEDFMSRQPAAYLLVGAGVAIALVVEMLGVPALIFALGMYLPLELNSPALVGGFLSYFLGKRSERRGPSIRERGVIIASGLMAGRFPRWSFGLCLPADPRFREVWIETPSYNQDAISQTVSAILFAGLCACIWWGSHRWVSGK